MRLSVALGALLAVGTLLVAAPSQAQIVVDQSQTNASVNMANFIQTDLAQSFQPGFSNIIGARLILVSGQGGGASTITISLWDALPNNGGNLLATGSDPVTGPGDTAEVIFNSAIPVTVDTTYFLVFESTNLTLGLAGDVLNPYPRGQVFANGGFGSFPNFDYAFQTLSLRGNGQAAPEPGTLALAGIGLVAFGAGIRKRRR